MMFPSTLARDWESDRRSADPLTVRIPEREVTVFMYRVLLCKLHKNKLENKCRPIAVVLVNASSVVFGNNAIHLHADITCSYII